MKLLASMPLNYGRLDCYKKDIMICLTYNDHPVWEMNLLEYQPYKYTFDDLINEGVNAYGVNAAKVNEIQYIQQDILKTLINNNVIPVYVVSTDLYLMSYLTDIGVKILEERIKIYKILGI